MPPGGSNFPQTKGTSMRNIPLPACFAVDRVWNRRCAGAGVIHSSAQQDFPYAAYELGKMYRDALAVRRTRSVGTVVPASLRRISRIGTAEP